MWSSRTALEHRPWATTSSSRTLAPVYVSETWLTMRGIELVSGESEPAPLKSIVSRIHLPVLLIASNAANERAIDAAYRPRIGRSATLLYVPDATHTSDRLGLLAPVARIAERRDHFGRRPVLVDDLLAVLDRAQRHPCGLSRPGNGAQ